MKTELITEIKKKLLQELKTLTQNVVPEEDWDMKGDEGDEAQAMFMLNMMDGLRARSNHKAKQIVSALRKIETEEYGICEECGEPIEEKRLLFNPQFCTCIICAEQLEKERGRF